MARTTPDGHDLIPEVLEILKAESKEVKRSEVHARIQPFLDRMKFDQRDRSIDWALNRLQKEGLALNTRRGFWKATAQGMARENCQRLRQGRSWNGGLRWRESVESPDGCGRICNHCIVVIVYQNPITVHLPSAKKRLQNLNLRDDDTAYNAYRSRFIQPSESIPGPNKSTPTGR